MFQAPDKTFLSRLRAARPLHVFMLAVFVFSLAPSVLANSQQGFGESKCARHPGEPAEKVKALAAKTRPLCTATPEKLNVHSQAIRGENGLAKKVEELVAKANAATQDYVNKKAAAAQINQAEAANAVKELLTTMRGLRTQMQALEEELHKRSDLIRKEMNELSKLNTPLVDEGRRIQQDGLRLEAEGKALQKNSSDVETRVTEARTALENAQRANQPTVMPQHKLRQLETTLTNVKSNITRITSEIEENRKAFTQIEAIRLDIRLDENAYKRFGATVWNPEAQKLRLAKYRVTMNDPEVSAADREAATKGLVDIARQEAVRAQAQGQPAPPAGAPSTSTNSVTQTSADQDMRRLTAGTSTGQRYDAVKAQVEQALREGGVDPQVLGRDATESVLNRAEERGRENIARHADYFVSDEMNERDHRVLTEKKDQARAITSQLVGMEMAPDKTKSGLFERIAPTYAPVDQKRADELYRQYNAITADMTPEQKRYWAQEMGLPLKMDNSQLYARNIAYHSSDYDGKTWTHTRDTAAGVALTAGGAIRSLWAGNEPVTVQDPGWMTRADNTLSADYQIFRARNGELTQTALHRDAYVTHGVVSESETWGQWWDRRNTDTIPELRAQVEEQQQRIATVQAAVDRGETRVTDASGVTSDAALALARETEAGRDLSAHVYKTFAADTGHVSAHCPECTVQMVREIQLEKSNVVADWWNGGSRIIRDEANDKVADVALGTVGGLPGQAVVASRKNAEALQVESEAYSYNNEALWKIAEDKRREADQERAMIAGAGVFTFTGQTVVTGGIAKVAKESYMLSRSANIAADVARVADAPAYSVARQVAGSGDVVATHMPAGSAGGVVDNVADTSSRLPGGGPVVRDTPSEMPSGYRPPSEGPGAVPSRPAGEGSLPVASGGPRGGDTPAGYGPNPGSYGQSPASGPAHVASSPAVSRFVDDGARAVNGAPPGVATQTGGTLANVAARADAPVSSAASNAGRVFSQGSTISEAAPKAGLPPAAVTQRLAAAVEEAGDTAATGVRGSSTTASALPAARGPSLRETLMSRFRSFTGLGGDAAEAPAVRALPSGAPVAGLADNAVRETSGASRAVDRVAEAPAAPAALKEGAPAARPVGNITDGLKRLDAIADGSDSSRPLAAAFRQTDDALDTAARSAPAPAPAPALKPAETAGEAAGVVARAEKLVDDVAKEAAPRAGTFADQARIYGAKTERYLGEIERLADARRKLMDPAVRAAMGAEKAEATLKKLEKTSRYFERRLENKYFVPRQLLDDFQAGVANGTIKQADIPRVAEAIAVRGIIESPLAKGKVLEAENKYRKILEAAAKSDGASLAGLQADSKLAKALEAGWRKGSVANKLAADGMPPDLARNVAKAFEDAAKAGGDVKDVVPFLARSLAEAEVLSRNAPVVGRNMVEVIQNMLTRPVASLYGGLSTTGRITAQLTGARLIHRLLTGQKTMVGAKSFGLLALQGELARATHTSDRQLQAAMAGVEDAARGEELARSRLFPEKTMQDPRFAKSLLLQAEHLAGRLEGRVGDLLAAQREADPMLRQLKAEIAERALVQEHKVPKQVAQAFRRRVESGGFASPAPAEVVKEQASLLAQEKFLAQTNVYPRVAKLERELSAALKGAGKSGESMAAAEAKLRALNVPEEIASRWLSGELKQPGAAQAQGELKNIAGSLVLASNAREMLGKDFVLNSAERLRRYLEVGKFLGVATGYGLAAGGRWVAGFVTPREAAKSPALTSLRGLDEVRLENMENIALAGLARVARMEGDQAAAMAVTERALSQAGYKPENIRAAAEAVKRDALALKEHFKDTPFERQPLVERILQSKAMRDDYLDLLKRGPALADDAGGERASRLLAGISGQPSGVRDAAQLAARAEERYGAKISLGNLPAHLEGQAGRGEDGSLTASFYSKVAAQGQIGSEAVVNHEARHLRNLARQEQVDKLFAQLSDPRTSAAERESLRKQLHAASLGSAEFRPAGDFRNMGQAYSGGYSFDEQEAYLVSAVTYVNRAEAALREGERHAERLRASANLVLAESTLRESANMAEASRQNLQRVKEALEAGGKVAYSPDSGKAVVEVRGWNGLRKEFELEARLPRGLASGEAAEPLMRELVEAALKRNEELTGKTHERVMKLYSASLARLETPGAEPSLKGRGVPVYTARALEESAPAVRAAAAYREAAEDRLAFARRRVLAGKAGFEEYEKAAASMPLLGARLPAGDEGARRVALLREEETFQARRVAKLEQEAAEASARRDAKAIQETRSALKKAELEHAGIAALALGQAKARLAASKANPSPASRKALLSGLGEQEFARHQASFPGRSLEQVLADSGEAKLLASLKRADAIQDERYLTDARQRLERTLATHVAGGDGVIARRLADDLLAEHGARPGALRLADRGWSKEMLERCPPALCSPSLDLRQPPDVSLVAREAALARELPAAGARARAEARSLISSPPAGEPRLALKRAEEVKAHLSAEAAELAKKPGSASALAEVKKAQEAAELKAAALRKEAHVIEKAAPPAAAEISLRNSMVSEVMLALRTMPDEELAAIHPSLAGRSQQGVAKGEERLRLYRDVKDTLSELPASERAQVLAAVKDKLSARPGLAALKQSGSTEDALAGAFRRSDELVRAGGEADPAVTRALYRDAKLKPEEAALADALGLSKASTESGLERRAELVAAQRSLDDDLAKKVAEATPAAPGRAPASFAEASAKLDGEAAARLMRAELEKATTLDADTKKALSALADDAKALEAGRTQPEIFGLAAAMRGLAGNPDIFESMRISYAEAAKAKLANPRLDREQAMQLGVRKMLTDAGFAPGELDGMVAKTMATLACMRL